MQKILFFLIFMLALHLSSEGQMEIWTRGNARVPTCGHREFAVFGESSRGLARQFELSSNVAVLPALPNLRLKKLWYHRKKNFYISSRHTLYTAWPAMWLLQLTGYKDIVPADAYVPKQLVAANELMFSKWLIPATSCTSEDLLLTVRGGVKFGLGQENIDLVLPEYPVIFPETQLIDKKPQWFVGVDLDWHVTENINAFVDVDFQSVEWAVENFGANHKGMVEVPISKKWTLAAGYMVSYNTYIVRDNQLKFSPLLDFVYTFDRRKKDDRQLWDKNMRLQHDHL